MPSLNAPSRRDALHLLAAGMAASLSACSKPVEKIVPYVRMPEGLTPGEPGKYATALPLGGYARGVVVTSVDGRPIKVEGNPRHPASLGATDVFAEAAVLSLYDPDRSQTVLRSGEISSWEAFRQALAPVLAGLGRNGGAGLRLVSGNLTSPTLLRQLGSLGQTFPQARWCAYEPTDNEADRRGAMFAFGRDLSSMPRLDRAATILSLDADPLGPGPDQIRNGRGYIQARFADNAVASRLYAIESAPTLTGAKADNRLALYPALMGEAALAIANALGANLRQDTLPDEARRFVRAVLKSLQEQPQRGLVLGGRTLPAETHALIHWINARLDAPVEYFEPIGGAEIPSCASLEEVARDLDAGAVDLLLVLDANPAFDAPADLDFATKIKRARFSVHAGTYADETAADCQWHVPLSHPLESWSDLRGTDGVASIVQPLIRPLYATRTHHEIITLLQGALDVSSHALVRETWAAQAGVAEFDSWWTRALHDGVIPESAAVPVARPPLQTPAAPPQHIPTSGLTIVLQPDPCLFDGRFANNAWLQELPKPLTKQVWGNALAVNPVDAQRRGLAEGDLVRIEAHGRKVEAPVVIASGHADGVASLTLGYGRTHAGLIGTGIGSNAAPLRTSASPWLVADASLTKLGKSERILKPQNVVDAKDGGDALFPVLSSLDPDAIKKKGLKTGANLPTLFKTPLPDDGHAWAMVIDAAACIGCNACVVACQAENNVPVVGPEEIAQGRQMHWLRVDVYNSGSPQEPQFGFQPVPCMHCEQAPCEPVCPVHASVHDSEGLNVQVYNRCIGTRFCEANCPYKVRRFNFLGYADGQEYANLGLESYWAQRNPEVTVRARGVMEKCTYCVQRISGARRAAKRDGRDMRLDEVTTACQDACPTRAITFGDLHQAQSVVNTRKRDPRHYALLAELGTRPRTTYLAEIRNTDPETGRGA